MTDTMLRTRAVPHRLLAATLIVGVGCAAMPSASQVGHTAGGIAGALVAPGVGMPIGALVGTVLGMVIDGQVDKVRQRKEQDDLTRQLAGVPGATPGSSEPAVISGTLTRVWVDERVDQGRLIAGHFEARTIQ